MRRFPILLAAVLAVALAAVAAGCMGGSSNGGGSSSGGSTTVQRSASDTLRIMGFGSGDEVAQARIALAKKALAPAKVDNPTGGFDDQQFLTRVASGNVPDLVYLDRQKVGTYAAKGTLQPLTDCIDREKIDMGQYRKPALDEVTWDGDVYALPEFYSSRVLMIDSSLVDPAKVTTSSKQALEKLARTVGRTAGGKVTRIGFDPKLPEFFPLWVKAFGGDIISSDGRHAQLDSPEAIDALRFTVGLIDAQGGWGSFKSFRDTFDFFGAGNEFAKHQLGAFPMEDWYLNVLAQNSPQVKLVAKPFETLDGKPLDWETGSAWAIPRGAKHPELACLWAKTMTSVPAWIAAAKARLAVAKKNGATFTGLYTANEQADRKIYDTYFKSDGSTWAKAAQVVQKVQDSAFGLPASPAGAAFQQAWQRAVESVLAGQKTPAAALKQAQDEAQRALDAAAS